VLPLESLAVMVMLKEAPAVCEPILLKTKWSRAPALTVKELLTPDFEEPEVPIVIPKPDPESVTEPAQTPAANAEVLVGLIVPEDTVKVLVPV
jgi:hypothetical protein